MTWRDLSDDELRTRLARRVICPPADEIVRRRDEPEVEAFIDGVLGGGDR